MDSFQGVKFSVVFKYILKKIVFKYIIFISLCSNESNFAML